MSSIICMIIAELSEPAEDLIQDTFSFLESRPGCRLLNPSALHIPKELSAQRLIFPELEIDLSEQTVFRSGVEIPLSHYEFFSLCYLAKHPGWVFTRGQIHKAVWNEPGEYCGASVTSVISQIRRKLWLGNPLYTTADINLCPDKESYEQCKSFIYNTVRTEAYLGSHCIFFAAAFENHSFIF